MNTLQSLLYIWRGMLSGTEYGHIDGDALVTAKVHPEGRIYMSSHQSGFGAAFRSGPRLVLSHAEHDLSVHIYKCIMGHIDWARQALLDEDPGVQLSGKWVLAVYELYELYLDTMEIELSRISASIPEW